MSKNVSSTVCTVKTRNKNNRKIAQLYFIIDYCDTEIFGKQLNDDFEVNYKVDSNIFDGYIAGSTIFQMIRFYDNDASQMLIDHGADYTVTNIKGLTTLLQKITSERNDYLDKLKITTYKEEPYVDIVLSAHIKSGNAKNPKDQNGLSHFHAACMYNHTESVNFFLDNGVCVNEAVSIDSAFCPGYSALHFAAKSCAVETAELLLKSGADMFAEDSKGMNPLHVLIVERIKTFISLKRLAIITTSKKNESHYPNLLNLYARNKQMFSLCLEQIDECRSDNIDKTTYFLIHLIITTETADKIRIEQFINNNKENFAQLVNTGSQVLAGCTPLHFAALFSSEILEILMKNGANLSVKDFNKLTPFDICLKGFNVVDLHRIVSLHPDYSRIIFSNRKTKLSDFIYAMQEVATFENFLKNNITYANMFIPFDSSVCAGFTPLHLAVVCTEQPLNWSRKNHDSNVDLFGNFQSNHSLKYLSRIDSCLRYNPEVTSRDARGSTPLHWAFRFEESYVVHRLLQRHETSSDYVDEYGLSHLHIACAAKDEALVEKLILGGADANRVATLGYTWLDVYSIKPFYRSDEVYKYFINEGSTPLHFAVTVCCPKIVEILVNHGANVLAKDSDGMNALERMLNLKIFIDNKVHDPKEFIIFEDEKRQIVELLVRKIANTLVDTKPDHMMYCYRLLDDSLALENICQHKDESMMKILENWGITALHVACFTKDLWQISILVAVECDVNARVDSKSQLWPGCTPLHLFTKHKPTIGTTAVMKVLLERGVDVAAENSDCETPLHQFFQFNSYHTVLNMLLQHLKDFTVNPTSKSGITHLHIASAAGAVPTVEMLLKQGAEVDQPTDYFEKDYGGYTALHFAVANGRKEVVDILLKHGADANWINTYGGNALHVATKNNSMASSKLFRTLFSAGADIHARNMHGDTPFENLIKNESHNLTKREINFFFENGCRAHIFNPVSDEGLLAVALNRHRLAQLFEFFVQDPSVKDIDDNGRNSIHNLVSFKRPSWEALEVWTIDEKYTPLDEYITAIGSLRTLGLNIDHQDCKGFTPLHLAAEMQNITGIIGLLENGADINITDADGKIAFAYSLELAELYEERAELHLKILKAIAIHIFKLNLVKIGVSKSNKEVDDEIRDIHAVDESKVEKCTNEVEKMMKEYVDSQSFTFYELLSDTGAVSGFPYMLPSTRTAVDNFFKNEVATLRQKFPEFTGILLLQYRKALARCDIIHSAVASLDLLLGFDVPAVCSRIILSFLSNDQLTNLVSSTL